MRVVVGREFEEEVGRGAEGVGKRDQVSLRNQVETPSFHDMVRPARSGVPVVVDLGAGRASW